MITLSILVLTLFILFCALTYYSTLDKYLKLIVLPVLMLFSLAGYAHYVGELGKPYPYGLPEGSTYVFHKVTHEGTILVWLSEKEAADRLYVIPYSREAAKELQGAQERAEGGKVQSIVTTERPGGDLKIESEDFVSPDEENNFTKGDN